MDVAFAGNMIDQAMKIYKDGGNTRSYAVLTLEMELTHDLDINSIVYASSNNASSDITAGRVFGTVMYHVKKGSREISVLYEVDNEQNKDMKCRVGAKVHPMLDGCFPTNGIITLEELKIQLPYIYNPKIDNKNDRSLQTFSTKAISKMKPCTSCEYWFYFDQFFQFYGITDYADKIVNAAADGIAIKLENGEFDFTNISVEGRGGKFITNSKRYTYFFERQDFRFDVVGFCIRLFTNMFSSSLSAAIHVTVVAMNLAIGIIRQLELAWTQCLNCPTRDCQDLTANDVDGAWAMYTGSLEGTEGTGDGKLWYAIADTECQYYKTCGAKADSISGIANVNIKLMEHFQIFQQNVTANACAPAREQKDIIQKLIFLPLIQATMRYAYIRTKKGADATDIEKAMGSILAASVAPIVATCSYHDAYIIMKNMEMTNNAPDYVAVQNSFISHLDCLGLKCKDIGGLWNVETNDYYYDFQPCTFDKVDETPNSTMWTITGAVAALGLVFILCLLYKCCRGTKKNKKTTSQYAYDDDSDDDDDDDIKVT